ncbi:MAG TPA: ribosome maturation factor RimP [Bacteroidota bacterium]|nr:ribosome maturation factor RimP [Bacteroidota bacterium]
MVNEQMRSEIERCVEGKSAYLIDLVMRGTRGRTVLEVFIDAEEGVTSDLCSAISHEVGAMIDRAGWFTNSYRLEVSSPGTGRPLRFPWQYRKHVGRTLRVKIRTAEGLTEKTGRLSSVRENGIVLEAGKGAASDEIPFASLEQALVETPW